MDGKGEQKENSRYERWEQCTKALLTAVGKETCQPYSIPVVPEALRKPNESAYIPKVVSIGPRYKGRRELLHMEEIKWRCVTTLLRRTRNSIERCMEAVLELDAAVRASYVDEITLDRYALATTMIFDGCFLLELLICESMYASELPILSPGIQVKKMDYVISDLMLLDNQIPIFILELLFEKLLGPPLQMRERIQNLALALLGFSGKLIVKSTFHFLDTAYSYMEMGWNDKKEEENNVGIYTKLHMQDQEKFLYRCATRLKAVGITIQHLNDVGDINFISTTEFDRSQRILKIPKLTITNTTEASWRSFIAWEHHKKNGCLSVADRRSICTSSALLFSDLICCTSDVKLLKDRKIIEDCSGKNNRDLVTFFHSIAKGIDRGIIDPNHAYMFNALNTVSTANYAFKIFILLRHSFCKMFDWCYDVHRFLKRGYNFAAAIVSLLTVVQTFYAVVSYHYPKK